MKLIISPKRLIYISLFWMLNMYWITWLLGIPLFLRYAVYLFVIAAFVMSIPNLINKVQTVQMSWIGNWSLLFGICVVVGWIINGFSIILTSWAMLNQIFVFCFFAVCSVYLKLSDIERIMEILCKYQILNCMLVFVQFILGYKGDYLGGIWGVEQGCNAYSNVYLILICTYCIVGYFSKSISFRKFILVFISAVLCAALSELTAFFLEIVIVFMISIMFSRTTTRKVKTMFLCVLLIPIGFYCYIMLNPERISVLGSIDSLLTYLGGQEDASYNVLTGAYFGGAYSVSRINPFSQINRMFFEDNWLLRLFGFGLGNCGASTNFSILQSDFFKMYGKAYTYHYFSHASIYLELGLMGIILYSYFAIKLFRISNKIKVFDYKWAVFGICVVAIYVVLLFYNNSNTTMAAYMIMIALSAIPVAYGEMNIEKTT